MGNDELGEDAKDNPTLGDALVAHPDGKIRIALRLALKKSNLRSVEAPTANRTLRLAQTQQFRVAIIGREFPGDEGGELIQEIVRHRPLLPMIVVNNSRSVDAAIFAKRIGAIAINTPIDEVEVINIVRRLLEATGVQSRSGGPPLPMEQLAGFRFIRALGPGGNRSMVLLAKPPMRIPGEQVAVKILMADNLPESEANDAICDFMAEAQMAATLDVTGLVPILDHGYDADKNVAWVAYQFVDGFSLGHHYATSRLPLPRKLELLGEICRILAPLHEAGIVHGNLRPSSILIDTAGQLLLTNYGEGIRDTRELTVESARYVSPEVVAGAQVDGRSDLFSVGAVGYRLVCGVSPFDGASPPAILAAVAIMHPAHPRHHVPHLPSAAGAVLKRLLKKCPSERYQTATRARDALREAAYLAESASESGHSSSNAPGTSSLAGASTWFNIPKDT